MKKTQRRNRPTLQDIAREAGVSSATVSYVLNGTGSISPDPTPIRFSTEFAAKAVIVADGESPEGVQVGVILWSRDGALSGLEVHPWRGSDSVRLPAVDSLMNFRK